jgi:hypothetical protein
MDVDHAVHDIRCIPGDDQLGRWMVSFSETKAKTFRFAQPARIHPLTMRHEGASSSPRRPTARIPRIDPRQGHSLVVPSHESFNIDDQHDLRPGSAGKPLPIQSIHVQPEKYLRIDQPIPFRRQHADKAGGQRAHRQRLLIPHLHPIRQHQMLETLGPFDPFPFFALDTGLIQ